jgi:hypothetical protein
MLLLHIQIVTFVKLCDINAFLRETHLGLFESIVPVLS